MGDISIARMVLGAVQTNCYIIYDQDTKEAIIVDPAKKGIYDSLTKSGFTVAGIILTHGHFDHIMGIHELTEMSGAKVYVLAAEDALCRNADLNASSQIRRPYTIEPDVLLNDGDEINIAGIDLKVIATPGHTKGSCCYYIPAKKWLISGDTLFCGSIGRSDLPTGNEAEIMKSVNMLVNTLDEDVEVYPGHGDFTNIGYERKYNPFCS